MSFPNTGATRFLAVSHLIQMDAGVDRSFGLVAFQVGAHRLLTHAHGGKHLTDVLQRGDNNGDLESLRPENGKKKA